MSDRKITELTELTSVDSADLLAIVDDPSGSPITKKITKSNFMLAVTNTYTKGQTITIADTTNQVGLTINQNDTTNNPNGMNIVNAGTSHGLYINQTGILATNKNGLLIYSDSAQTASSLFHVNQASGSSTNTAAKITNSGTGIGLYIAQGGAAGGFQIQNTSTQYSAYINRTGIGASNRPNLYVIDANASTAGRSVQIDNAGTGGALHINQTGNLSANTEHGLFIDDNVAQTDVGTSLVHFRVTNASAVNFPVLLVAQASESNAIWIDQTGAGRAFVVNNDSYGHSAALDQDVTNTNWTLGCFDIVATSVVNDAATYTKSGNIVSIVSNVTETSGVITDSAVVLNIQQSHAHATGDLVFLNADANILAINIDKDCTVNNTRTWAVSIASDNAGTGTALGCGIDMSAFSVDEPLVKVPADVIGTVGTVSGQIAIDVAGTTYYIPYYTTGS